MNRLFLITYKEGTLLGGINKRTDCSSLKWTFTHLTIVARSPLKITNKWCNLCFLLRFIWHLVGTHLCRMLHDVQACWDLQGLRWEKRTETHLLRTTTWEESWRREAVIAQKLPSLAPSLSFGWSWAFFCNDIDLFPHLSMTITRGEEVRGRL